MQHIACAKGQAILPGSQLEPSYLFLSIVKAGCRVGGGGERVGWFLSMDTCGSGPAPSGSDLFGRAGRAVFAT